MLYYTFHCYEYYPHWYTIDLFLPIKCNYLRKHLHLHNRRFFSVLNCWNLSIESHGRQIKKVDRSAGRSLQRCSSLSATA